MNANSSGKSVRQEDLLLDYARRADKHREGRRAVFLDFSALGLSPSDRHITRQAASFFHAMVKAGTGQLFRMTDGNVVFTTHGASKLDIENATYRLLQELSHDPVVASRGGLDEKNVSWFNLEEDYDDFLALAERLAAEAEEAAEERVEQVEAQELKDDPLSQWTAVPAPPRREISYHPISRTEPSGAAGESVEAVRPITPADLDRLESSLRMLDVAGFMNTEAVVAMTEDAAPRPVFCVDNFRYDKLGAKVLPGCDLRAAPLLFERLVQLIDVRVLKTVTLSESEEGLATSLTSHVEAVLSDAFTEFHFERRRDIDRPVIIEFRFADAMRNARRFFKAHDLLRQLGYKICIKDMDIFNFCLLDRRVFQADFEKIRWSQDTPEQLDADWRGHFDRAARPGGFGRLILEGCTSKTAVDYGLGLGIRLFQGAHVEAALTDEDVRISA